MHRFGLGSHNPSEMRTIAVNPKAWLMRQLDPRNSTALPGTFWDSVSILKKFTAELQAADTASGQPETVWMTTAVSAPRAGGAS